MSSSSVVIYGFATCAGCARLKKYLEKNNIGFIYKDITFSDNGTDYSFREEVKILLLSHFERYMKNAGLTVIYTFGNYNLDEYDQEKSNRLIIVAKK